MYHSSGETNSQFLTHQYDYRLIVIFRMPPSVNYPDMRDEKREEGGREQTGWRKEGWIRKNKEKISFVRETFLFTGSHIHI